MCVFDIWLADQIGLNDKWWHVIQQLFIYNNKVDCSNTIIKLIDVYML